MSNGSPGESVVTYVTSNTNKGLKFDRVLTKETQEPYGRIAFVPRRAEIKEPDELNDDGSVKKAGKIVFEMDGVVVPEGWSQAATNILASKYFRKAQVPNDRGHEFDARDVIKRIARAIVNSGLKQGGYFETVTDANVFEHELESLMIRQMGMFNSPVLFNLGLAEIHDIRGEAAGSWAWQAPTLSPKGPTIGFVPGHPAPAEDGYTRPGISACFIQSIDDDLMDIAEHVERELRVFKWGGGSGSNFSKLRGEDEALSGGGTSSGLMSFLEIFDRAAGAMRSGGVTRRAAKLVCINDDHPDLEKFIDWKAHEEDKARALVVAGFGKAGDFNSEAFKTIGGQNANNSVRVTDAFMKAVVEDLDWSTTYRTTGKIAATKKARHYWRKMAQAAWRCADPAMMYHDTINSWNTCPVAGTIEAANPCVEYHFLTNSACNLASLNLVKFLRPDGSFDAQLFSHAVRIFIVAQEILVDHASYPTKEICQNSHDYRPLGLGYANIGALLMRSGLAYDSNEGRGVAAIISALMTGQAYVVSAEIAQSKGAFPGFAHNRDPMLKVIAKHREYLGKECGFPGIICWDEAINAWSSAATLGEKFGFRNSQVSLIAPTGTIGLLMDCDTLGIEPEFQLVKTKTFAGGGKTSIVNKSVEAALEKLNYPCDDVPKILDYVKTHGKVVGCPQMEDRDLPVFDCAVGERAIEPYGHIEMLAAVQPFLSGSASKTVNLPNETTVEEIEQIYMDAWKRGLKCIAIYRDGSKEAQVLETSAGKEKASKFFAGMEAIAAQAQAEVKASQKLGRAVESLTFGPETKSVPLRGEEEIHVAGKPVPIEEGKPVVIGLSPEQAAEAESKARAHLMHPKSVKNAKSPPVAVRHDLPAERAGGIPGLKIKVGGVKVYLHTGDYEDGSLGEIFLRLGKQGDPIQATLDNWAIAVSIGLQCGVPLAQIIERFRGQAFEPRGPFTGLPGASTAASIIDAVIQVLERKYLDHYAMKADLRKKITALQARLNEMEAGVERKLSEAQQDGHGFGHSEFIPTGQVCPKCHGLLQQAGSCLYCQACGESTGGCG